ncbi:MAG: twin-arginine translocase subunit TatC [Bacteroidales bacterium]|nr:twin-arginine translocase subunit TatC [Bacteroidales bacterium]
MAEKDGEMSFWDHLEALRGTLFRSVAAIGLCSIIFLAIPQRLFQVVLWPTQPDFILYSSLGLPFEMTLINVEVSAQFFVHLKVAILCGLVVAFPYVIYEIWRFIAPALYEHEKKAVRAGFGMSSGLFYLGVAVGYFVVLPVCLMFFMNYTVSDTIANTISLSSYMSLFTSMVFLIGLLFEFPTVILVLSSMGVVHRAQLRNYRKYAFVVVLILSAFITPSDPFSMFVLAIPLYGLYEFSIFICKKEAPETEEEGA